MSSRSPDVSSTPSQWPFPASSRHALQCCVCGCFVSCVVQLFAGVTRVLARQITVLDRFTGSRLRRDVGRGSGAADGSQEKVLADAFLFTLMGSREEGSILTWGGL